MRAVGAVGRAGTPTEGRELRARGQRTVRKLIDAGIDVFGKRGYHSARVDDIVRAAKTSHGTFYLYFSSKEDLFRALAIGVAEEMTALVDELGALTPNAEGREHLRQWLRRFAELYRHYGPIIRAWTEADLDRSEVGQLGTDLLGQFSAALARRIARIPRIGIDPQVAAVAIVAMIERFSFYSLAGQTKASTDERIDTLTEVIYAGLFGPPR